MAPASYKLTYFNGRGLAETIHMPFGKVPALEVDGKLVGQSNAIARYLARKYDLAGKDDWEALQIDSLVDALGDFKALLMAYRAEVDPKKKEEKKQTLLNESIPFYMNRFEQVIKDNNGYLVGGSSFETFFGKDSLSHYPQLKELQTKVYAIPKIAAWIERRPQTEF
ncbi:hypothetical protein B566_EDAN017857 [Ephemera danica]|nr:hypothetical protein B566_EDAN017857 [Ephemera danica]